MVLMLFCLELLLLLSPALDLLGVTVKAFTVTTSKDKVQVNVRQNATLQWNYEIAAGERYDILWGTSSGGRNVKELLFRRNEGQSQAQPSSNMPSKFAGRVKIIKQATLFIQRVDLSDDGFYMCQINGQFVTLRKPIQLIVIDPPRILPLLQQTYVWNEGNNTELACHTDGKPKPRVTWKKGNVVLKQVRKVAKLNFPSVSYKDAGSYTCIAENAGGRKRTQVEIYVLYAPKDTNITTDAPYDTVSDGSSITITCKAHGNPTPEYKFYVGGKRIRVRRSKRSGVLSLTALSLAQGGSIYSCQPENDKGKGPRKEVMVFVRYSPEITLFPQNTDVNEYQQISVRCEAKGFPPPKIKWVKLLGNRKIQEGTSLFIQSVQRSDQGRYRCVATNGFGDPDTADFEINVYYAPKINRTASSQNVPAWTGATRNLSCVADGNPAPRYIWTNSSGIVATSEASGLLQVTQGVDGFGPYTCTVSNRVGNDQLAISLVKVVLPEVPKDVSIEHLTSSSVQVGWTVAAPNSSNTPQIYHVELTTSSGGFVSRRSTKERTLLFTHLRSNTRYRLRVQAENNAGNGSTSPYTSFRTKGIPPVIVSSAPNAMVVAGHSMTLQCGDSRQKIFWYKEGSDIHFDNGHTLVIQDASSKDEGIYHCAVRNGPKGSLKVLVIEPPVITNLKGVLLKHKQKKQEEMEEKWDVFILCETANRHPLEYVWKKDGEPLTGKGDSLKISLEENAAPGEYECHVTNLAGTASKSLVIASVLTTADTKDLAAHRNSSMLINPILITVLSVLLVICCCCFVGVAFRNRIMCFNKKNTRKLTTKSSSTEMTAIELAVSGDEVVSRFPVDVTQSYDDVSPYQVVQVRADSRGTYNSLRRSEDNGENVTQVTRPDYLNISPSNRNDSAANCMYAPLKYTPSGNGKKNRPNANIDASGACNM